METKSFLTSNSFPSIIPISKNPSPSHSIFFIPRRRPLPLRLNSTTNGDQDTPTPPQQPTIPPQETVEIRFRRRSRRRNKQQKKEKAEEGRAKSEAERKKKWEEMSVGEKAAEVYVGEKGLLYWLNKLAYASIFIVIGGWIAFRFIGPALNLYQLDTTPLPPSSLFKSS